MREYLDSTTIERGIVSPVLAGILRGTTGEQVSEAYEDALRLNTEPAPPHSRGPKPGDAPVIIDTTPEGSD